MPAGTDTPQWERVFIGLGSNLGDRRKRIAAALDWLSTRPDIRLVVSSEIIETEPWGVTDQPRFLNAVAEIATRLDPRQLLAELKRGERILGRADEGRTRWGPREIDLDILLFGHVVLDSADLTIPHPRLVERRFVLEQLVVLDPSLSHPASGVLLSTYLTVM